MEIVTTRRTETSEGSGRVRRLDVVAVCRLIASLCAANLCASIASRADVISDWNRAALDAIRVETTSPPLASRNLAMLHATIFDALNSIGASPTYQPYHFLLPTPAALPLDLTAASAAYRTLSALFPSQEARFQSLLAQTTDAYPQSPESIAAMALGTAVADRMLEARSSDGASTSITYIPRTEPGQWRRTPPFFRPPELTQWGYVTPFTADNLDRFHPPGPPELTSARYAADFNQVKTLGAANSSVRTAEQTLVARFWSDFSYTATPPGHWNVVAQNVAADQSLNALETARLFALLNLALADAAILVWDVKYDANFWRPVTAIHAADTDDNPETEADPDWLPLLNTPPFPEYVSGHSTFSAAAATVLAGFFGTDHLSFEVGSDTLPGVTRTFDSFMEAADEIGMSRIYGGIHFLSADLDGLQAGSDLGHHVVQTILQPIPEPSILSLLLLASSALTFARLRGKSPVKPPAPRGGAAASLR